MAEKKITKREKFEMVLALVEGNDMLTEFINHEIELLTNKASKSGDKKNEEHEAFFEVLRDVLVESANPMTCGAILKDKRVAEFAWKDGNPSSSQRVSAMLKKLIDKGDVVKTIDKKVSYFALA